MTIILAVLEQRLTVVTTSTSIINLQQEDGRSKSSIMETTLLLRWCCLSSLWQALGVGEGPPGGQDQALPPQGHHQRRRCELREGARQGTVAVHKKHVLF